MRQTCQRVLAVGFFDGVHLGHQAILRGASAALTFRTHPLSVLAPARAPRLMMALDDRLAAIRACGVGEVTVLDFTPALASMPAADFVARYVTADIVRCGADWRFGQGGEGDADFLRARGFAVEVVPYALHMGIRISSSRLREVLARGEMEAVRVMIGRSFCIRGTRFAGKGAGAGIGFPTVNLRPALAYPMPFGVYEIVVGGVRGIANWGLAPTMGSRAWKEPVWELHFPRGVVPTAAQQDEVTVEVISFVRPERKFSSVEDLKWQIAADCDKISL